MERDYYIGNITLSNTCQKRVILELLLIGEQYSGLIKPYCLLFLLLIIPLTAVLLLFIFHVRCYFLFIWNFNGA